MKDIRSSRRCAHLAGRALLLVGLSVVEYAPGAAQVSVPMPGLPGVARQVADGAAVHAWLGVMTQDLMHSVADSLGLAHPEGALISAVMAGSPAHLAGLKPGDVIRAVDGEPVLGSLELSRLIGWTSPGDTVHLTVWRDRSNRVIPVRIGHGQRISAADRGRTPKAHWWIESAQVPRLPRSAG